MPGHIPQYLLDNVAEIMSLVGMREGNIKKPRKAEFNFDPHFKDFADNLEQKLQNSNLPEGVTFNDAQKQAILKTSTYQTLTYHELIKAMLTDPKNSNNKIANNIIQNDGLDQQILKNLSEEKIGTDKFNEKQAFLQKILQEEIENYKSKLLAAFLLKNRLQMRRELETRQGVKHATVAGNEDPGHFTCKIFQNGTGLLFNPLFTGEPMFKLPFEYDENNSFTFHPSSADHMRLLVKALQINNKVGEKHTIEITFATKQQRAYENYMLSEIVAKRMPTIIKNIAYLYCLARGMEDLHHMIKLDHQQPVLKDGFTPLDFANAFDNGNIKPETPKSLRNLITKMQKTIFDEKSCLNIKVTDPVPGMDNLVGEIKEIYEIVRQNQALKLEKFHEKVAQEYKTQEAQNNDVSAGPG